MTFDSRFSQEAKQWDDDRRRARALRTAAAIAETIDPASVHDVLEVGAGTGLLSFALAQTVDTDWRMTLSDISDGMLDVAREKVAAAGVDWTVTVMNLADGTPREAAYDLVISQMVLHHVDDLEAIFAGIHQILRPGGQAVLMDFNAAGVAWHWPRKDHPEWMCETHLRSLCDFAGLKVISYDEPLSSDVKNHQGETAEHRLFRLVTQRTV